MAALTLIIAAVAVVSFALWKCFINLRKTVPKGLKPLPGPKGYPIIGSVPDVPEKNSFVHFGEWSKKYGPIYQCNLAGTNHVWISTDQIARDLLSKKGNIYSDRPHIPALINDNRTSNQYLPLMSKNAGWTRQRKFANHIMRETEKASFYHYPELESVRLLQELMDNIPYNTALESFISRTTCRLAWGHPEASDELKQRARELLIGVSPTGALGNKIAALMSLPDWMVPAKAWERRRLLTERQWFKTMEEQVKSDTNGKEVKPSWMKTGLDTFAKWGFVYDMEASYCVGMHGIAGALTVAAPMQAMCLALCYYPQYQDMLHEELDRVCGDRMPRADDRPNLPVLRSFIRETLRWRPPVPTGIPHEVTQDDEYNGYHIPKGSVMHPLEWAIARDPELFPDPEEFNPLRWLEPEYPTYQEPLTQYPTIINSTQFGYGRRTCQGQSVADEDMLVGLGSLAWLFKISKEDAVRPNVQEPTTGKQGPYSNENATISNEELNAGMPYTDDEKAPLYPGAFPPIDPLEVREEEEKAKSKQPAPLDPTLDFSTLLIAKPLPFKFDLTIRNPDRARLVVNKFSELKEQGEFPAAKSYWKEGDYLGWGKV